MKPNQKLSKDCATPFRLIGPENSRTVKICLFLKFEGRPGNEKRSKQCYQEAKVDNSLPES